MKNKSLFLTLAATAMMATFAACSNDLTETVEDSSIIRFTSKVVYGVGTRATTSLQESQLNNGLKVGLFANAISADNGLLTADGNGNLTTSETYRWPASGTVDFNAYAPYDEANTGKTSIDFTVKADQSTDDNYLASDLLYGSKTGVAILTTDLAVEIPFKHVLSKVIVKLTAITTTITNPTITLTNVATGVNLDLSNGTVTAASTTGDVVVGKFTSGSDYNSAAVVAPQTIASGTKILKLEINGTAYTCSLEKEQKLESGKVYTFNVNFDGNNAKVSVSSSLVAWETGDEINVTPNEDIIYGVGDYLLADGSFIQKAKVNEATSNVIGVIFSTEVSSTDQAAGYNAYILGFASKSLNTAKPQSGSTALTLGTDYTPVKTLKAEAEDLDGLTHTKYVQSLGNTSSDYELYDLSSLATISGDNFSQWFIPSIGQFIQLMNNLGSAGIPTDNTKYYYYSVTPNYSQENEYVTFSGKNYLYATTPKVSDVVNKLKEATNGEEIIGKKKYAAATLIVHNSANETALMDLSSGSTNNLTDDQKSESWAIASGSSNNQNKRDRIACIAAKIN